VVADTTPKCVFSDEYLISNKLIIVCLARALDPNIHDEFTTFGMATYRTISNNQKGREKITGT